MRRKAPVTKHIDAPLQLRVISLAEVPVDTPTMAVKAREFTDVSVILSICLSPLSSDVMVRRPSTDCKQSSLYVMNSR